MVCPLHQLQLSANTDAINAILLLHSLVAVPPFNSNLMNQTWMDQSTTNQHSCSATEMK
jgi:hypothetical protein